MNLHPMTRARARLALREATRLHLFDPNVSLIDVGLPEHDGQSIEDELAIRFHVHQKFSNFGLEEAIERGATCSDLSQPIRVGEFQFQTDVLEGTYRPHLWSWWQPWPSTADPRATRSDPLRGGVSISDENHNGFATLGAKVLDRTTGAEMILSNWHVLVADWRARHGQRIYQPGRLDGGGGTDTVATLVRDAMAVNLDAAVAMLSGSRQLINDQLGLGPVTGVGQADLGMVVVKSGRRTGITYGRVTGVEGISPPLRYSGLDRIISHVVAIDPHVDGTDVSGPGDSGSLWLDAATMQAIGLHFAGSNSPERALANDIQIVLDALNINLDTRR
jgi:endonuclease G